MITIIELKRGKIKEIKICQDCMNEYLNNRIATPEFVPENAKELLEFFLKNKESFQDCPECNQLSIEDNTLSTEQKIKILQNKMAAAIKIEDYESAALIKKQIETIKNLN